MSGTALPFILLHDLETVIMVVERESSAHVTEEPWESATDYRGRTGVRDEEVVLAAPGVALCPPWARADRWGLVVPMNPVQRG